LLLLSMLQNVFSSTTSLTLDRSKLVCLALPSLNSGQNMEPNLERSAFAGKAKSLQ
jgi:hypothetical protein